jgi:hypothetical protein
MLKEILRPEAVVVNMATTALAPVGNSADSPEPLLRPSPAMGHDAEMLDV